MRTPTSRILVINDEKLVLRELIKGLSAAAKSLDNPYGIVFTGVTTTREALAAIEEDGDLQAVVVDDKLYSVSNGKGQADADAKAAAPAGKAKKRSATAKLPPRELQMSALELVQRISRLRPELNVYILIAQEHEDEVVDALFTEAVDGYFYREERDYRGMYRILNAQIQEKARTPFYDQLKNYVLMAKDAWHSPGHSGGDSLRDSPWVSDVHEFFGEHIFDADLSVSVPTLDSLMQPTGVIEEAQKIAAKAFGAKRTFFATNGTSTANKVILQTLNAPGEKLLMDRNCHKSVHHGVVLSGAWPIYLDSSVNKKYGVYGPIAKKTIFKAIEDHPNAEALILTSCTYDGLRYDLRPIIDAAHAKNIKVVIDEAWYGVARFHQAFRPTALESGADYVTQSTHKVMSAFSQSSMIHVNDPTFNAHIFRENFNMHTSTSPQYAMIASLDVARKQMVMEGFKLLKRTLALSQELRQQINSGTVFRALALEDILPDELKNDGVQLDPTKVTVDISGSGMTVEQLIEDLFERYNIQVEKSTFNTLSFLLTIGTTRSKVSRLYDALVRIGRDAKPSRRAQKIPDLPRMSQLGCLPRDAFYSTGELVPLLDEHDHLNKRVLNRLSCDQIVPYPPGIPVLVPGQTVNEEIAEYLVGLLRSTRRVELHGIAYDGYVPCLRVLSSAEEKRLRKR
jgi:arginine decarboxylase